jgi:hypothetical protein
LDVLTPELLYHLAEVGRFDWKIEQLKEAMEFAMRFLTDDEIELLFFRFIHGNSYKTLKKSMGFGSTKTGGKRTKKLSLAIKEYMYYYLEQTYEDDMQFIKDVLGKDAHKVAELMFKRMSKYAILHSPYVRISQPRLNKVVCEIELLCLRYIRLSGFWEVITTVGKFPCKKV